jgi:hypothetical protein
MQARSRRGEIGLVAKIAATYVTMIARRVHRIRGCIGRLRGLL